LREFGDFQTPADLVQLIIRALYRRGPRWTRALEPTCGLGSFIRGLSSLPDPPREIQGIEIQPHHVERARASVESFSTRPAIRIHEQDLFKTNMAELRWNDHGPLLVVGNPPWITNAELGSLGSANLPSKTNLKGSRGLAAVTGEANFDIAEYIWIKLIKELAWAKPTIALLCKTAVARNILKFAKTSNLPIAEAELYRIDAKRWFDASTDACLFRVDVGCGAPNYTAKVYPSLEATSPESVLSIANGALISNTEAYNRLSFLDGASALEWRQGVKHDLAEVMELQETGGILRNKRGDTVEIEDQYVYPLLKSSDLHARNEPVPRYRVIITQRQLGDNTAALSRHAPRLWAYLTEHIHEFRKRKSSIYQGRPDFAIFGVGEYSFSYHKVAVSGLYKNIRFRILTPHEDRPVMLDDTCYFVPCESVQQACVLNQLLNHESSLAFLNSIVFKDSKRPLTKKVLQRVSLESLLNWVDKPQLLAQTNERLGQLQAAPIGGTTALESHLFSANEQGYQIPLLS